MLGHFPVRFQVGFIPQDEEREVVGVRRGGVVQEIGAPVLEVFEGLEGREEGGRVRFTHSEKAYVRLNAIDRSIPPLLPSRPPSLPPSLTLGLVMS